MKTRYKYKPGFILNRWEILEEVEPRKVFPKTVKNYQAKNDKNRQFRVRHRVTNEEFIKTLGALRASPTKLLSECAYFTDHTGRENEHFKVLKLINDRTISTNCTKRTTWLVYDKVKQEERVITIAELNQLFDTNKYRKKRKTVDPECQYLVKMFHRIKLECSDNPKYNYRLGAKGYTFDNEQWPSCHEFIADVLEEIGHTPSREAFTLKPKEGKEFRKGNLQWKSRVRNLNLS